MSVCVLNPTNTVWITPALSCPFIADSSSLYRNYPSYSLAVLMLHVYQQSNISAVLSNRIQSCIVSFSSSGIRTNDPILPGTKRSWRTGGEDCGKRDGRGIISGMTSVLNHSRLAPSARVSERQFSKCHLSLTPTHTNRRGSAHTQKHKRTWSPQSPWSWRWGEASGARKGPGQPGLRVRWKPYGECASFMLPGPPLNEQAVWRHNPKYSINTTLISSKSVRVCFGGGGASEGYEFILVGRKL